MSLHIAATKAGAGIQYDLGTADDFLIAQGAPRREIPDWSESTLTP